MVLIPKYVVDESILLQTTSIFATVLKFSLAFELSRFESVGPLRIALRRDDAHAVGVPAIGHVGGKSHPAIYRS